MEALARGGGPRLGIVCPVHGKNVSQVEEVLRQAAAFGAKAFFQPVQLRSNWSGAEYGEVLPESEIRQLFQQLRAWRRAGRPVGNSPAHLRWVAEGFPKDFERRCLAGRYFHTILPDGALLPCCMVDWSAHRVPMDPDRPGAALRDGPPPCDGCSILPYVDNTLLLRPSLSALANALRW